MEIFQTTKLSHTAHPLGEDITCKLNYFKACNCFQATDDDGDCSAAPEPPKTLFVTIPPTEYMLGIADLTGELMRLAINCVGNGDFEKPFELCCFMRSVFDCFTAISSLPRELHQKIRVLKQSLLKVEKACYTLQVRGSEMPKHMLRDVFNDSSVNELESFDFF